MILGSIAAFFLLIALANALFWPGVQAAGAEASVAILIPARDEEANLPHCLGSAIATGAAEILVYDDHSTDATAAVVSGFAALDARVRLIEPVPLPAGWAGKTFACHTLAQRASAPWLLFLDADARLTPDAPARMAAEALARRLTLLSCWPEVVMKSFAERALMPMLNFVVFSLFPAPLSLLLPAPSLGVAHGACIMAERSAYQRLGGHELVRNEIFEDTRLAQAWRAQGERGLCLDGRGLVSVRMYSDFTGIWHGFGKNFYPAFQHTAGFFAFLALHAGVYLLPFLAGWWQAILLVLATRAVIAARFRHPLWTVLLHPFSEAILIAIGLASFWRCASRRGVSWKGRVYRSAS